MKFTVSKSLLMHKLTPAMGMVSNKNTITAIEGVLIETLDNGLVQISTYDMTKGFRATIVPVTIEREGRFIINAQRLYQTVRVLPDDDITFDINDKLNCEISCGKASFSMFALRGADFPNLPDLITDRGFKISAEVLKKAISKVVHSVAEANERPMLNGAYFNIKEKGMEVVSCDGFTLSKCNLNYSVTSVCDDKEYSFILPGHALGELNKILSDVKEEEDENGNLTQGITLYLSRKHAIIRSGDTVFFTRIIDSQYIDYNRMISKDQDISVEVDRERLLHGLERANIIAEEKIQGSGKSYVKVSVEDQFLSLTSSSVNGCVQDEMDCVHEGGDIEIGFNCRYLINSVKALESENIIIMMKSSNKAITLEPKESDGKMDCFYMVLPVRMNEGNN